MRFAEKLYKQMLLKGLNQQKLAKTSKVSDSEVSRILGGKSQPGLENAFRLAKAVGVSLDYLTDDALEADPSQSAGPGSAAEREILEVVRKLGYHSAYRILDIVLVLGTDVAVRRLLGLNAELRPMFEASEGVRPTPAAPASTSATASTSTSPSNSTAPVGRVDSV